MTAIHTWKTAVTMFLVAGLWCIVQSADAAYFVRGSFKDLIPCSWSPAANPLRPNQPVPIDMGKGIENKLDQLLEAIKSLNAEALKITYAQGILHGALAATLLLTLILALKAANK